MVGICMAAQCFINIFLTIASFPLADDAGPARPPPDLGQHGTPGECASRNLPQPPKLVRGVGVFFGFFYILLSLTPTAYALV